MKKTIYINLFIICLLFSCCKHKQTKHEIETRIVKTEKKQLVEFYNKDSAYAYVERQVEFGPRVPNTEAHKACALYLNDKLEQFCDTVYLQEVSLTAYNGECLHAKNLIGVFNPEQNKRVLLFAHWDSRPYSDRDSDINNYYRPIDGADDGASGVGVLLEIARQIDINEIGTGIDIIFFDAEDYGVPNFTNNNTEDTYCLGSQYWAKNPHIPNYKAEYGILLDMVGAKNATFYKELYSAQYAKLIVDHVWRTARDKGFGKYFIDEKIGPVTDDHIYVIKERGIPCINIINCDKQTAHGFGSYWHTQQDRMDNISHETLEIVGQTIMEVIYSGF